MGRLEVTNTELADILSGVNECSEQPLVKLLMSEVIKRLRDAPKPPSGTLDARAAAFLLKPDGYLTREGGYWYLWDQRGTVPPNVYAISFQGGIIFDMVNGWRVP